MLVLCVQAPVPILVRLKIGLRDVTSEMRCHLSRSVIVLKQREKTAEDHYIHARIQLKVFYT